MFTAVKVLLESSGHLNNSDNSDNSDMVTELLQVVEDAVRLIGPQLKDNYTNIETNQTGARTHARTHACTHAHTCLHGCTHAQYDITIIHNMILAIRKHL